MQGATLPVTREWPTKSLVSGTENVPAFCCPWAPACAAWRQIYIYICLYIYICKWAIPVSGSLEPKWTWVILVSGPLETTPFLCLALWNQNEPWAILGSGSLEPKWTLCHSSVWPIGNKKLGHSCVWLFGSDHQVWLVISCWFARTFRHSCN